MALRNLMIEGEEILRKTARPVKEINDRVREIMADMKETMDKANGVGIAAPQVGIMRRMFIAAPEPDRVYYMINPEILATEGEQESTEGCLSVPDRMGIVIRPQKVTMKAQDLDGNEHVYDFEGFDACVVSHEYDHLEGILYIDKADAVFSSDELYDEEEE